MRLIKQFVQIFAIIAMGCCVVACSDSTSDGGLELKASTKQIMADGLESVVFTVTNNGEDVTAKALIYKGTTALEGHSFTSKEIGEYKFVAKYEGNFSSEVVVTVVPEAAFEKNTLLTIWSSTNCVHCPKMANQLKNAWLPARQGQIVVMYYHMMIGQDDDDPFVVRDANGNVYFEGDMANWFQCIGGAPKGKLDADYDITYNDKVERIDLALKRAPNTGIAIETSLNGNKLHVKVKTKADGNYPYEPGLALWLTEDGLIADQADVDGVILRDYVHNYVVRASLCADYKGMILPEEYRKAGAEYVYETDYTIPADFVKENLNIVAYVYQNVPKVVTRGGHMVDNAQSVKAGKSIDYEIVNGKQ